MCVYMPVMYVWQLRCTIQPDDNASQQANNIQQEHIFQWEINTTDNNNCFTENDDNNETTLTRFIRKHADNKIYTVKPVRSFVSACIH